MQDRPENAEAFNAQNPLKHLTAAQFMALGGNAVLYVRPIKGAALAAMMVDGEPVEPEAEFQLVVSADGSPLMVGDTAEAKAIREVFGSTADNVVVSAPKSSIGHMLGAAGAVEAIASLLAIGEHVVPPTLNLEDRDDDINLDIVTVDPRPLRPGPAVSNSFGFGGHNVVLVFQPA